MISLWTNNSQEIPTFSNALLVLIVKMNDFKSYFYETVKYRLYDEWKQTNKLFEPLFTILITEFLSFIKHTYQLQQD
ncbi:hypothetical protein HYD72_00875 [Mycoplasmopsis bovis]|nr:hypothetical protein [Mycoplasmopsis bovis]QQH49238.1 hypothetical protein HYD72_00875 [Mycoplasmopsis bovis]